MKSFSSLIILSPLIIVLGTMMYHWIKKKRKIKMIVTKYGLLVIEDKDYSGWLFGSGEQQYWTQVLNYGKEKHKFYNPVMQNKGHIQQLKNLLNREGVNVPIYSVIVFHEKCHYEKHI